MNHHYDEVKARKKLFDLNQAHAEAEEVPGGVQVLSQAKLDAFRMADILYPPSVRLMEDLEDQTVEAMFKTYGVIADKMLPPIVGPPQSTSLNSIRNMRQHVKLTGFGFSRFDDDSHMLREVIAKFQEHVHDRRVTGMDFAPYEGHDCIESHARFFTPRNLVPYDKQQEFSYGVDPNDVLLHLQPASLIHASDNVVEYCKREVEEDGSFRYTREDPRTFREGDIVEMSFSFVGVRVRDGRMMVYMNLRALTLIDDSVRRESEATASLSRLTLNNRTPKRKMHFLSHLEVPLNHGLKKHRSEPALKTYNTLLEDAPSTRDNFDAHSTVTDYSDISVGDSESFITVDDSHLYTSPIVPFGRADVVDTAVLSQPVASGSTDTLDTSGLGYDTETELGEGDVYRDAAGLGLEIGGVWTTLQGTHDSVYGDDLDAVSVGDDEETYFTMNPAPMLVDA